MVKNKVFFHIIDQNFMMPACAQGKLSCFSISNILGNYIQAQFLRKIAKSVTIDITSCMGGPFYYIRKAFLEKSSEMHQLLTPIFHDFSYIPCHFLFMYHRTMYSRVVSKAKKLLKKFWLIPHAYPLCSLLASAITSWQCS